MLTLSHRSSEEAAQVYKSIKGNVLLTIAGAGGLSLALQATGIAMHLGFIPFFCSLGVPFGGLHPLIRIK